MIVQENHLGRIEVSRRYLEEVIGYTVASCFGVTRLEPVRVGSVLRDFFRKDREEGSYKDRGVVLKPRPEGLLDIDIYLSSSYGTNITAVCDSVAEKVRYAVKESAGVEPGEINIYVASVRT